MNVKTTYKNNLLESHHQWTRILIYVGVVSEALSSRSWSSEDAMVQFELPSIPSSVLPMHGFPLCSLVSSGVMNNHDY